MSENLHFKLINEVKQRIEARLKRIKEYQSEIPVLQKAKEELDFLLGAEDSAPELVTLNPSEDFMARLTLAHEFFEENQLPEQKNLVSLVSTSSSTTISGYMTHVENVQRQFPGNLDVQTWSEDVNNQYSELRESQKRSKDVTERLKALSPKLADIHMKATRATLEASSGVRGSVESAEFLREVLNQFKGEMINRCRKGDGVKFKRIAENLALESPITFSAICDEQQTYDQLHGELSRIAKSREIVTSDRTRHLLDLVEDHILIITSALDPEKIGINFLEN